MEEFQKIFKCKNCGAELELTTDVNGVLECDHCFSKWTMPKKNSSPAVLEYLRIGEHELDTCEFDKAYSAFYKAWQNDKNEPEAFWGMALAEFKVQYIKDIKDIKDNTKNRLQPICHEFINKQFTQNKNYLYALQLATKEQKEEYRKKAQDIDYIREEFLKIQQTGLDYDCFICVKVSKINDEQIDFSKKNWTDDAYNADAIYDLLKRNGYTPFFSEREIRGRTGADYEAMILYALYTSETMLVVCSNEDYLTTPWVKNEYTRFKELVNDKEKESNTLTIIYNKTPVEKLPGFRGKIQGIDYSRREADLEIVNFVEKHTPQSRERREKEKLRKQEESEALKRQIEEQKKAQRELEERQKEDQERLRREFEQKQKEEQERLRREFEEKQKELAERLNRLNATGAQTAGASATVSSLLKRAKQELEFGDYDKARKYFNQVLDADPENSEAWWQLFLLDFNVSDEKQLIDKLDSSLENRISQNRNYRSAVKYAAGDTQVKINKFQSAMCSPEVWWAKFLAEMKVYDENELISNISANICKKIDISENYAKAVKYADSKFNERLKKFIDARNSAQSYWKLFLEDFGVSDGQQLIDRLDTDLEKLILQNCNYQKAINLADSSDKVIKKFQSDIHSPQVWWLNFLAEMHVTDEKQIIANINNDIYYKIDKSENYAKAVEYAEKYNDVKFQERIQKFDEARFSSDTSWRLFLEDFEVKNEQQLLDKVTPSSLYDIQNSLNFKIAVAGADGGDEIAVTGSDGEKLIFDNIISDETRKRVKDFTKTLYSGELWWNKFLQKFRVKNENVIIIGLNEKLRNDIENDPNFILAKKYATDSLAELIDKFVKKMHSAKIWWSLFLREAKVSDEQIFIDEFNFDSYNWVKEKLSFIKDQLYIKDELAKHISLFEEQLDSQAQAYKNASDSWNCLLSKFGCRNNIELESVKKLICDTEYYKRAITYAQQCNDKKLLASFERTEKANRENVNKHKASRRAAISKKIAMIILCLLPSILIAIIIPVFLWNIMHTAIKVSLFTTIAIGSIFQIICLFIDNGNEARQPIMGMLVHLFSIALILFALILLHFNTYNIEFLFWAISIIIPITLLAMYLEQISVAINAEYTYGYTNNIFIRFIPIFLTLAVHIFFSFAKMGDTYLWHVIVQLILTTIAILIIVINDCIQLIPEEEGYSVSWITFGAYAGLSLIIVIVWLFWQIILILIGIAVVIGIIVAIVKARS